MGAFRYYWEESNAMAFAAEAVDPMPGSGTALVGEGEYPGDVVVRSFVYVRMYVHVKQLSGTTTFPQGWWDQIQANVGLWCDEGTPQTFSTGTPAPIPGTDLQPDPGWISSSQLKPFVTTDGVLATPTSTLHSFQVEFNPPTEPIESQSIRKGKTTADPKVYLSWACSPGLSPDINNSGGVTGWSTYAGAIAFTRILWRSTMPPP